MNDFGGHDDLTHAVPSQDAASRPAYMSDDQAQFDVPRGAHPAPAPRRNRWLVPVVLLCCGVLAFALVSLLINRDSTSSTESAPSSSPSGSTRPSSTSRAPQSSPTDAQDAVADFPRGVRTTCGGGAGHESEQPQPLPADVRVNADDDHAPSCEFVTKVRRWVDGEVAANPGAQSFSRDDTSARDTSQHYREVCSRSQHLTTCTIGNSSPHNYVIYVRDSVR